MSGAVASGLAAGALHALALGAAPRHWLAWVALVPLLRTAARARGLPVFCAALAYALALLAIDVSPWFVPTLERYFRLPPPLALAVGAAAIAVTAAAYGALLGLALVLRRRAGGALGVVWCAALWAVWEMLCTALFPPFFPLSVLGTSQVNALPVLQVASVAGIAGVTALVVAVNAALAQLPSATLAWRRRLGACAAVVTLALAAGLWGGARLASAKPPGAGDPTVLLVDGAARDAAESTVERYIAATTPATGTLPALVVWPESALPVDLETDTRAWTRLLSFVDGLGAPLVTGGAGTALAAGGRVVRFNSVHFIRPRHGMLSYHKRLLVPFAESWPAALGAPPPAIEPVAAGREPAIFGEGPARFGPLICFEITDAASVRGLVRLGARFVVNVNNDVWFGPAEAPHQAWARVRAVESGLAIARAANGGASAIIDPVGRLLAATRSAGRPVAVAGAIPAPIATVYTRTGEVFLPACALVVLAGLVPHRRSLREADMAASG